MPGRLFSYSAACRPINSQVGPINSQVEPGNSQVGRGNSQDGRGNSQDGRSNSQFGHKTTVSRQRTQDVVFREIQREITLIGSEKAKKDVISYMERLYDPSLEGALHFYAQDRHSLPTQKIPTITPGAPPFFSTLLLTNKFDVSNWTSKRYSRPDNFVGPWPPRKRADLLGNRSQSERSSWKNEYQLSSDCVQWHNPGSRFWYANLKICFDRATGYGLYARKSISGSKWMGQYTGRLRPRDDTVPDHESEYNFGLSIGKLHTDIASQAECWCDATREGSVFRFMAHSCEPNAGVEEMMDAQDGRVLAVFTIRDIRVGEAITIDYGTEWFRGDSKCLCGSSSCKNPPESRLTAEVSDLEQDTITEEMLRFGAVPQMSKKGAFRRGYTRKSSSSRPDHQDKDRKRVVKPKRNMTRRGK